MDEYEKDFPIDGIVGHEGPGGGIYDEMYYYD
jgi:hypothetical protein